MTAVDPVSDRTVEPSVGHPGMVQIVRGGRCFQIGATTPEARDLVERHADAVINGTPLPEYGRRWNEREDA